MGEERVKTKGRVPYFDAGESENWARIQEIGNLQWSMHISQLQIRLKSENKGKKKKKKTKKGMKWMKKDTENFFSVGGKTEEAEEGNRGHQGTFEENRRNKMGITLDLKMDFMKMRSDPKLREVRLQTKNGLRRDGRSTEGRRPITPSKRRRR